VKAIGGIAIITLMMTLFACGGSTTRNATATNTATGAWSEELADSTGQQLGSFTFDMMQNNTALTGSAMNFGNMGGLARCFGTGTTMSGQMGAGMMSDHTVTMTMSWTDPNGAGTNTMTMQGNMPMGMGSASGTFTLTGQTPGCTDQTGTFTMNHTSRMM